MAEKIETMIDGFMIGIGFWVASRVVREAYMYLKEMIEWGVL
jgi:hypothetical protein